MRLVTPGTFRMIDGYGVVGALAPVLFLRTLFA
jgi:hypothetical protein